MRKGFLALLLGLLIVPAGCGAPEQGDQTGLDTPEAEAAAQQAREAMEAQQAAGQHGAAPGTGN